MARKISLEAYLELLQCPDYSKLSVDSLNQIIALHGFRKLKGPKSMLIDAAECVGLIDPSRSTLSSSITPDASITMEDCVAHLNALKWQECCVTSIHSFPVATESQKPKGKKRKPQPEVITHADAGGNSSSALMSLASC